MTGPAASADGHSARTARSVCCARVSGDTYAAHDATPVAESAAAGGAGRRGLRLAERGQAAEVGRALNPALRVRVGLAVAEQQVSLRSEQRGANVK